MGEKTVKIFLVFFFLYAFWNLVYLLNTFGSVGQAFILPGEKKGVLMIMVLAAGVCGLWRLRSPGQDGGSALSAAFFSRFCF